MALRVTQAVLEVLAVPSGTSTGNLRATQAVVEVLWIPLTPPPGVVRSFAVIAA